MPRAALLLSGLVANLSRWDRFPFRSDQCRLRWGRCRYLGLPPALDDQESTRNWKKWRKTQKESPYVLLLRSRTGVHFSCPSTTKTAEMGRFDPRRPKKLRPPEGGRIETGQFEGLV